MARAPKREARDCLAAITLDEASIGRSNRDVEHERAVAIYDLLADNKFKPAGHDSGPYALAPFSRIVKDYFTVCDSYYAAIRTATPDRIEALDMGRRALHDEGSRIVMERLRRKVELDFDTARRLFTLITVLHWKG